MAGPPFVSRRYGGWPLFRGVDRHDQLASDRLTDGSIARIVQRAGRRAGLDPARYAGPLPPRLAWLPRPPQGAPRSAPTRPPPSCRRWAASPPGIAAAAVLLGRTATVAGAGGFHRFARERTGPAPRV
jgi:hypothetical protein